MVYLGGFPEGPNPYPLLINANRDVFSQNSKMAHDMYNVYVNKDYVGKKVLVAQGEKVEDINSFLKVQGFDEFKSRLEGNSYEIDCDTDESKHMKEALQVYLRIR